MVEHYRARVSLAYYRCNRLIHESIVRAADNAVLAGFLIDRGAYSPGAVHHADVPETLGIGGEGTRGDTESAATTRRQRTAHILRRTLRRKRDEIVQAGFAETSSSRN